jgi:dihydropteroate synthase
MLDLSRPRVMGILNVTPDSFYDGGRYQGTAAAVGRALAMQEEGAAILDIGGESTRPGAEPVPVEEELRRVVPVVEAVSRRVGIPVSVDTSKPQVMRAAVAAGAGLINDVLALQAPGALEAAAEAQVPVCLMHMRGAPRTMQRAPVYQDVAREVREFLLARVQACEDAGMGRQRLVLDPGIGFGKTVEHNLCLLARLDELSATGLPVLVGVSRKSLVGALLGQPAQHRLYGSLALAVFAAVRGAVIIRAHDVRATVEALRAVTPLLHRQGQEARRDG